MKNLILITFLFTTFQSNAQTSKPIDGFLGIKFGCSAAEVTEALKAKGGIVRVNSATSIGFSGISLGNRKANAVYISFVNDKAFEAQFAFVPDQETKTIEFYNALVSDVSDAYGPGKASKIFKQPYQDGDGYEITAIKSGNADYRTMWTDGDNNINAIIQSDPTSSKIYIRLFYTDGKLRKLNDGLQKEKNKSEF